MHRYGLLVKYPPEAPNLLVKFFEVDGVNMARAVAVEIVLLDIGVIASTRFDADSCAVFSERYERDGFFGGLLYDAGDEIVGDVVICPDEHGAPLLLIEVVPGAKYDVPLPEDGFDALKAFFAEVGRGA